MDDAPNIQDLPPAISNKRPWLVIAGALLAVFLLEVAQIYWAVGRSLIADIASTRAALDKLAADEASGDGNEQAAAPKDMVLYLSFLNLYHDSLEDWLSVIEAPLIWRSTYESDPPKLVPGHEKEGVKERPNYTEAQRVLCVSPYLQKDDHCPPALGTMRSLRIKLDTFTEEDLITSNYVADILQSFVLPFFYGLLGAFIYVLRQLGEDTVPSPSSTGAQYYWLRLPMGALAGVAIGWILNPSDTLGSVKSLQPFVFAFLAGYGVEILFSGLDRIVAAFTQASPTPGSH